MIFLLLSFALSQEIVLNASNFAQVFNVDDTTKRVSTTKFINRRTDTTVEVSPAAGSEEFILAVLEKNPGNYPTPLSKEGWTIKSNSEYKVSGNEGPASNLIDGDATTFWRSCDLDCSEEGHDERPNHSGPYTLIIDTKSPITFKSLSLLQKNKNIDGYIRKFKLYVGDSESDVNDKISKGNYILDDYFADQKDLKGYLNLSQEVTAQFIALVTPGDGKLGTGAQIDFYNEFLPTTNYEIKSSDLKLKDYKQEELKLTFNYEPYEFMGVTYDFIEVFELEDKKDYLHKYIQFKISDSSVRIDYIDLDYIALSEEDLAKSWGSPLVDEFFLTLGQPIYINTFYTGCRFPDTLTFIYRNIARDRYYSGREFGDEHLKKNADGYYTTWKTVFGAARSERIEVVRNDFFSYISDISVPAPFRKQYNSWYDWMLKITEDNIMTSFKEIEKGCTQYGLPPFDSYVVDDGWNNYNTEKYGVYYPDISGTTYNEVGFWTFNNKFPQGLTKPSDYSRKIGSNFGVWLGPRGGYVTPGQFGKLMQDAGTGFYAPRSDDVDVGSNKYIKNMIDLLIDFIREYKVNYYKLDGYVEQACNEKEHDHMVGGPDGIYFFTDLWEHVIEGYERMIAAAKETGLDNFWISSTTFVSPSPFHLQWSNSVWIQISGDLGEIKIDDLDNKADLMLTYRDDCYWQFYDEMELQFPANNLYNHDPIYGQAGTTLRGALDDEYFRTFLYGCAMRGTAFFELYYTYDMLAEGDKWYVSGDVLSWAEKNHDTLQHSQFFGGRPGLGEVYGFSAWNTTQGALSVRNPSGKTQTYKVTLDRNMGVPEVETTFYRSTLLAHCTTATEEIANGVQFKYGDVLEVTLQKGEYRIYEFKTSVDEEAPAVEVIRSTAENEVLIRFDKRVNVDNAQFSIEGLTVDSFKLRGDRRTVTLTTSPMTNTTTYKVSISKVFSIFEKELVGTSEYQYFSNNAFAYLTGEFQGTDSVILSNKVSVDSFTIRLNVKDFNSITNGVLIESDNVKVELVYNQVKFTVGDKSVTSENELLPTTHTITCVRERNALIKIYFNTEIDSSAWDNSMPITVDLQNLKLVKNDIVYDFVAVYNYAFGYDEVATPVSLKNDYFEVVYEVSPKLVKVREFKNFRTDDLVIVTPQEGTEEFVISVLEPNPAAYPTPLDKSKWTATANSESATSGTEGPITNILDGNKSTYWRSCDGCSTTEGGHDERPDHKGPYTFYIDAHEQIKFKAVSLMQKKTVDGVTRKFQLFVGNTKEEVDQRIANGEYELDDMFQESLDGNCYLNFSREVTAQFIAIVTKGDGKFATAAGFDLYSEYLPTLNYVFKTSDLLYKSHSVENNKVTFTFETFTFRNADWDINEIVEIEPTKHYLHKYLEIKCSDENVKIDYIDLDHIVISDADLAKSWGSPLVDEFYMTLGQPIYINTFFTGCRFPCTHSYIHHNLARDIFYSGRKFGDEHLKKNADGYYTTWKTVFGAARSERIEVVRNDFFSYISDISVPAPFRKQYNSWYDWMLKITEDNIMTSFKEIEKGCTQYGLPPFDSYVVDDGWNNYNTEKYGVYDVTTSGTTYNQGGFWEFNDKFPQGLTKPSDYSRKIGSNFGVWLGPRGGYVTPGQFGKVMEDAGTGFYAPASDDIDVGSNKYIKNMVDLLIDFIREYKVNYFKLDGFVETPCKNTTHDHMVGGPDGIYFFTDLWEHVIEGYERMIAAAKETGLDNFWISSTTWVSPSPFHLQWSNSVWIQISGDKGEITIGDNNNQADQMLTYRDDCYWSFYDEMELQFPANNLYNHDPIYGQAGTSLRGALDDEYFRTFLYGCAMRGTAFFELYYTYDMLAEGDKWYVSGDVLSWAEKNHDTLQHSQFFGGRPGLGEVYGFSAWNTTQGALSIRNPGTEVTKYTVTLDRNIGVPEVQTTFHRYTLLDHCTTATEEIKNEVEFKYGDVLEVTLQPAEYRIYEFKIATDRVAPKVEVIRSTAENEVLIRFDKRVNVDNAQFSIEGLTVDSFKLRGDRRTVTLTTSPMSNQTHYTVSVAKVYDISGNEFQGDLEFTYFGVNTIVYLRGEFSGTDSLVITSPISLDSFTIRFNVKDFKGVSDTVLIDSENVKAEIVNNHIKFTVGNTVVTSESEIKSDVHYITLVRERNALIKIYFNTELDNSAYDQSVPVSVTLENIKLVKNELVYSYFYIFNYAFAYSEVSVEAIVGNKYIQRVFTIANDHIKTSEIINYRTDDATIMRLGEGSEEWVFTVPGFVENKLSSAPKAIDRTNWKVTANSEQTTVPGLEGAAVNMIDGSLNTIWHSQYNNNGEGGHDDRGDKSDPFQITFDLGVPTEFQAFSYTPRQSGTNGRISHYELYVGQSIEELNNNIKDQAYVAKGDFNYVAALPVYVNLTAPQKAQFVALLSVNHDGLGSGADFSLYEELVPLQYVEIKSSDCEYESYDLQLTENGQIFKIVYKPYTFNSIDFSVEVTYEIQNDKPYIEKQISISVPESKYASTKIDHIDLESFVLSHDDLSKSWTHPIREREEDSGLSPFVINLGQPVYINTLFTGCRFPLNDNAIVDGVARLRYHTGKTFAQLELNDGKYICWKTVIGAARSNRLEVVRNDLFSYIADISVETKFRKQYNSWYDWMLKITEANILESFKEIERGCSQYGVPPLDSYVVDDGWNNYNTEKYCVYDEGISGTTYNQGGFWEFNDKFPQGLTKPSDFSHRIASKFGVWLGPRGGYVTPGQFGKVIEDAGKGYYNAASGDIDVGSIKYINNLKEILTQFIRDYKVNYYKLDGFASEPCQNKEHDHMVGGENGAYYFTDLWERYEKVFDSLRTTALENEVNDFWISITCFVNPSPFHLQWANSVWFQLSGDVGYIDIGGNSNLADQMLTYRDKCYYMFYDYYQFQFPQRCLYNHDPIYGKAGTELEGSLDDEYFRLFLYMCAMRGNAFTEMYYTYSMLDEGEKWYVNAEVLRWTENRFDVLQHSQRFGGNPELGDVYGYSAWNDKAGTIAIRNPSGEVKQYTLTLDRDIGVPESIPVTYRKSVLTHKTIEDVQEGSPVNYNDQITVTLQPGEARIIDFEPSKDETPAEIEVAKTTGDNEIMIRFNKRVLPEASNFEVSGITVSEISLKADLRTVFIKLSGNMENRKEYTVKINDVVDQLGNKLTTKVSLVYKAHNLIVSVPHEFLGDGTTISTGKFSTDSFSVQLDINNLPESTDDLLLLEDKENAVSVKLNSARNVVFTVGSLEVVSTEAIPTTGASQIICVRERNTMVKIYINGAISNSAYDVSSPALVTLEKVAISKSEVNFSSVFVTNYGLTYKDSINAEDIEEDDSKDGGSSSGGLDTTAIIGIIVGVVSLVVIVVVVVVFCRKRSTINGMKTTPLLTQDDK